MLTSVKILHTAYSVFSKSKTCNMNFRNNQNCVVLKKHWWRYIAAALEGRSVAFVSLSVCLYISALTGKRIELSTPKSPIVRCVGLHVDTTTRVFSQESRRRASRRLSVQKWHTVCVKGLRKERRANARDESATASDDRARGVPDLYTTDLPIQTLGETARRSLPRIYLPRKQFPRSVLVTFSRENVANTSRGNRACRTRMLYKNPRADVRNKSYASDSWNLENYIRHTDKRAALYTAADRRPTNRV